MTPAFEGTPSDELPAVLELGRSDVTTVFLSMSARHAEGRDAEYLRWHALDHRPEQHRLDGLRGSMRLASTAECRAVRAASHPAFDAVDHIVVYLFAGWETLGPFLKLGQVLGAAGRMPIRLPRIHTGAYVLAGKAAAPRAVAGVDVLPWRPALGVYVLIEEAAGAPAALVDVDGVAGAWWAASSELETPAEFWVTRPTETAADGQITLLFLDDDPVVVAGRLRPQLEARWASGEATALWAAPFHTVVPYEWDRHLP